jgi:hypothetical protein
MYLPGKSKKMPLALSALVVLAAIAYVMLS